MSAQLFEKNDNFIGRVDELNYLESLRKADRAQILILYGRRRIGKTELIEQAYHQDNVLKFEGLEGQPDLVQMAEVMRQLSEYTQQPLLTKIAVNSWQVVFQYIADAVKNGPWIVYFEEIQWLANYKIDFISALKYIWDNFFRHNKKLLLILCGSSPSFIIKNIIHSKALYNRSSHEMGLSKLTLLEAQALLAKKSQSEVMDAYLTIGGVPEYLQWLKGSSSIFTGLCQYAFKKNGLFLREFEKIFVSSLAESPHYKSIIKFLAKVRFASRSDIAKHLKISSGGSLTKLLDDLVLCEFIQKYSPYNLSNDTPLARYCINDEYLQFYYHFIYPIKKRIQVGDFNQDPTRALSIDRYRKWLGFAFERFCRHYYRIFAKMLDFAGIEFTVGPFFNRATEKTVPGYQIDLLFERKDKVYTICEIKYLQTKVSKNVIDEFEKKLELFPNKNNYTIQRVLITNYGAEQSLVNAAYFDRIITFDDIFNQRNWSV